jgi:hypothetical protein
MSFPVPEVDVACRDLSPGGTVTCMQSWLQPRLADGTVAAIKLVLTVVARANERGPGKTPE